MSARRLKRDFVDIPDEEEVRSPEQQEEDERRRQLEGSMSSIDQLEDFETYNIEDLIYREYEPVVLLDSSNYERFDRLGRFTWKTGRPSHWISFLHSLRCVFETTVVSGILIGLLLTLVVFLDVNLSDLCSGLNFANVHIPVYIIKIRIVSDMISSVTIQFWHLITLLLIFKWSLIKDSNIISWNILAGLLTGMYKLFMECFTERMYFGKAFHHMEFSQLLLLSTLKISTALMNIITHGNQWLVVLQLMAQFVIGLPVAIVFMLWINPAFKNMGEIEKIAFASFVPILIVIPKMIVRKTVESLGKVNHPGTSIYLLTAMYTGISLLYRTLQVQVDEIVGYAFLSIIFGILCTLERATVPYLDFLLHKFLNGKIQSMTEFMTPRRNRLMSDLTLINMITEPAMIIISCATMAVLQYLYDADQNGIRSDLNVLCKTATKRIAAAMAIEVFFNVLSLKIESYYFNMAVMRVWKKKRIWILFTLTLSAVISIMCFSHVIYEAMRPNSLVNGTLVCSKPFGRPSIIMKKTI
ncbi:LOW QUALITY PROTEIN: uncharacterized protein LOC135691022 [Rhopilema esculentum]|uniref:LOW QUALITY PROTEIN: uncharacterized protein LOC135691022 n=1 Tax=Rhopilema esculentum TaxID=499914 RepID=UPI0031E47F79